MHGGADPHRLKLELTLIAKAWKRRRDTTSPASHGCPAYQDCLPGKPLPQSGAYCAIQGMPGPHFA